MEPTIQISDVQYLNLNLLTTIQSSLRNDPIAASFRYRLSSEQAERILNMSLNAIHTLVANMRHECLFAPRENFMQLLDAPPALAFALSAVSDESSGRRGRDCPREAKAA